MKARLATLVLVAFTMAGTVAAEAQTRPASPTATLPQASETEPQPSVLGLWQMTSDEGKPILWILFVKQNGIYKGVVAKMFPRPFDKPDPVCHKCTDDRHNQPVLGIELIRGMRRQGMKYTGGNILDPRDGDIYHAQMTLSPDAQKLTVRGYLGIPMFGMDQVWQRLPNDDMASLAPTVLAKYRPDELQKIKQAAQPRAQQMPVHHKRLRPQQVRQVQPAKPAPQAKKPARQAQRRRPQQNEVELIAMPRPRPRMHQAPAIQRYDAQARAARAQSSLINDQRSILPALH